MYFEILKTNANQKYHFVIKSNNGEIVAVSENYSSKQSAKNTIESIKNSINSQTNVEDKTGE